MSLITPAQRALLLANGRSQSGAQAVGRSLDLTPVVRLFTPDAQATWLLTELSQDGDTAFGLADLGLGCPELGYVSLAELRALRGPLGLEVERDKHFYPVKPISWFVEEAQRHGRIGI